MSASRTADSLCNQFESGLRRLKTGALVISTRKGIHSLSLRSLVVLSLSLLLLIPVTGWSSSQPLPVRAATQAPRATAIQSLSAADFSKLINELSEEGGYFRSDNFTSNETSYLTVVDKLKQLGASGGAYMGVGPEQNFTYIAKVRPQIAIIVDIRRQAIIQHLMYKAVFHLSPNPSQFLSRLLSRPLTKDAPPANAPIVSVLSYLNNVPADEKAYSANLAEISKTIEKDFQFPLNEPDRKSLEYVYQSFKDEGLDIAFRIDGSRGYFPNLKDIIEQADQHGKLGNFLASADDYNFVRDLHKKNLIIPVVGDFGGKKALASVGEFLKKNGYTVTAFYTSNVEQYLFDGDLFASFANNVRKLPLTEKSLFIRAIPNNRFSHPAQLPGHRLTTLLQPMTVFLKDFDAGKYLGYRELVLSNYIAPDIKQ